MNEVGLAYQTVALDEQKDQVILEQLPQVYYLARRIHETLPQHVPFEDLVHAGVLGLMEAFQKFDARKNVKFKSYAKFRIRGAIIDSLRDWDWSPRPLRRKGRTIDEAIRKLGSVLGRYPTESEIAGELGVSLQEFHETVTRLASLEIVGQQVQSSLDSSERHDLIESAPADESENPFSQCLGTERREHLARAIGRLSEKEQIVISLYYKEELTMKEIATVVDLGESRVSQIHSVALAKLRAALSGFAPGSDHSDTANARTGEKVRRGQ